MALGQVLPGNFINADDLQDELDALEARLPIRARSTTATTFTSSTTFGNITGLSAPVAANSVYKFRGRLKITGANATHDFKNQWSLPASATVEWSSYGGITTITTQPNAIDMGSSTTTHARGAYAGAVTVLIEGFITTAGTAGTAQLQGAQNTSDGGTLSFDAGSEISLELWV